MNKQVYAEVQQRAQGMCEGCRNYFDSYAQKAELDHYFGRAKAEEVAPNCWMLCTRCHHSKTSATGDAWAMKFIRHCARQLGAGRDEYLPPLERALTKLAVLKQKGFA